MRYRTPEGSRITAPTTFATKTDAHVFLAGVETDIRRRVWQDPQRGGDETLTDYARRWLAQRTVKGRLLAPRTVDTYRHSLERWIVPTLGDRPIGAITPADVRGWHQNVMTSTGPTATRQAYALLRAILNTAVADDAIARNPCRIRGAGQPTSPERPLIDVDQVEQLADAMPDHLRTMVTLAFWGHARLGELLGLRVSDIDFDAGTLRIERQAIEVDHEGPRLTEPKVGSIRTVHPPTPALDALRAHASTHARLDIDTLFVRADGRELRAHHVHAAWHKARISVGLPGLHFHDLRHAGLTLSAQSGATLAEVMRRAGHSSSAAAMRYQHAAHERDAEIAALMTVRARRAQPPGP